MKHFTEDESDVFLPTSKLTFINIQMSTVSLTTFYISLHLWGEIKLNKIVPYFQKRTTINRSACLSF